MKKNSKVSVALHTLFHMVDHNGPVTSEQLGKQQQINPVTIRRILGSLKKFGIVKSEKGHGGGWIVLKQPSEISFQDIFDALDETLLPKPIEIEEGENCIVLKSIASAMEDFLDDADLILRMQLKGRKLDEIFTKMANYHQK